MTDRKLKDTPPRLVDVAAMIEARMHAKSGKVTLHYQRGRLEVIEWGDREDSRALVKGE